MVPLLSLINRLLPFATPGTPLLQDLVHLAVICTALYFAPQIQEWVLRKRLNNAGDTPPTEIGAGGEAVANHENLAEDIREENQVAFEHNGHENQPNVPFNNDFQAFQQHNNNDLDEGAAGPADPNAAANIPAQRNVGAKKAKSLAKKDQRRAYHEFQRVQGEAQRAKDAEGAAEREAAQAAERERRRAAEAKLDAKKAKEREAKREQERTEREEEIRRRGIAIAIVKEDLEHGGVSNLIEVARRVGGEADDVWVERMVAASGLLGKSRDGNVLTFVTSTGYVVRAGRADMEKVYESLAENEAGDEDGKIGFGEVGRRLEGLLRMSK